MSYIVNPWGLTPQQCATLESLSRLGEVSLVSEEMRVKPKTVVQHMYHARQRMGIKHRIPAVVAYALLLAKANAGALPLKAD